MPKVRRAESAYRDARTARGSHDACLKRSWLGAAGALLYFGGRLYALGHAGAFFGSHSAGGFCRVSVVETVYVARAFRRWAWPWRWRRSAGWIAVFSVVWADEFGFEDTGALLSLKIKFCTFFCSPSFWVSGFDIIYSTLDEDFDRTQGLHSLPARFGRKRALGISAALHAVAFVTLAALYVSYYRTPVAGVLLSATGVLLFLEQYKSDHVDLAFFKFNGIISFLVLAFIGAGVAASMKIVIGISGASGAIFGYEFLKRCPAEEKYVIVTDWGRHMLATEADISLDQLKPHARRVYRHDDVSSPLASGSNVFDAMVIIPCSVATLGKIANGIADSLLTRAAEVALKERRKLILCVRETPLSTIALDNALKLSRDGVIIMPVSPPFYTNPKTIDDVVVSFADKVNATLGIPTGKGMARRSIMNHVF